MHLKKFEEFIRESGKIKQPPFGYNPRKFWRKLTCNGGIEFKGIEIIFTFLKIKY
ncbi:hypothetical protein GCM10022260_23690 [Gaetbulibacter aestuarii]